MPLVHMLIIPSLFMNSLVLKSVFVCMLTVIHSNGLVNAAPIAPAINELAMFAYISFFAYSS